MFKAIEKRLVDNWCVFYKRASVWLAALVGTLTAVIIPNQGLYLTLVSYLPAGKMRVVAAIFLGFLAFAVPTITVLWKQKSVSPPNG